MPKEGEGQTRKWQLNMVLTAGVLVTVLLGLMLAQLDALQARAVMDVPGLPIINIQATAIAVGRIIPLDSPPQILAAISESLGLPSDDTNPRPEFITGISEEGAIFTVCGEVPEGWLLYTVRPGETLASLAVRTDAAATDLAGANCLVEGQLTVGMQILLPRQPAETLCGPPQWWVRYEVQPADTIEALAGNRATTVEEILRANCRDSLALVSGQMIFLPPGSQPLPGSFPVPQPSLTPLPPPTAIPTIAPLPSATSAPPPLLPTSPPPPTAPFFPTPIPTVPPPPTVTPPPVIPTDPPPVIPTDPPPGIPTQPPPAPTDPPPAPTDPPPVPTDPPPAPTDPPPEPTDPPPAPTDPPPEPAPTEPPPTDPPP